MNVSTIKLVCWLGALGSFGGLAKYAYDWFQTQEARQLPIDIEYVAGVLNENIEVKPDVRQLVRYDDLKGTFMTLNWTGEPPPPPRQEIKKEEPKGPKYVPLDTVLSVFMIRFDTDNPGGSVASVTYKKERVDAVLEVGDKLMAPYDYAVVKSIKPRGLVFAFTDPERSDEELFPGALAKTDIIPVGPGGPKLPRTDPLPKKGDEDRGNSATEQVARGVYDLGYEDMEEFGRDYGRILTEDVTTATWMKDGKRAGVEIKSVRSGSIASRHGAMEGDVLISINGHKVTSESEAISYVKDNQDNYDVWEVVVLRFGKEETMTYHSKK